MVVRSITALLSKTVTTLNYYYRGTSPHCSHCLAAAEATGLLLQVFRVCFTSPFFFAEISEDGAVKDVQVAVRSVASAVPTGLPVCAMHGAEATGLHRAGVLCGAAQCLCVHEW